MTHERLHRRSAHPGAGCACVRASPLTHYTFGGRSTGVRRDSPCCCFQARDTLSAKEGGASFVSGRHVRGSSRHYRRSLAHRVLLRSLRVQPRLNGVDDRLRLLRRLAPSLPATFVVHDLHGAMVMVMVMVMG